MTNELQPGKYYTIHAISRVINCSQSKLYTILYRPEFDKFRRGSERFYGRQLYKYCEELITMVNAIYEKGRNYNANAY